MLKLYKHNKNYRDAPLLRSCINIIMINLQEAAIYWIHLPQHTDFTTQGYIGVSKDYSKRLKDHVNRLLSKEHRNPHLIHAFNKYGWDNLIKEVILFGEESYCYQIEGNIRSTKSIGWNIAVGGHRGPGWPKGRKKDPADVEKGLVTRKKNYNERLYQRSIIIAEQKEEKRKLQEAKKNAKLELSLLQKEEKRKLREQMRSQGRELCPTCSGRPVAINCIKNGKTYYRKVCDSCSRIGRKLKPNPPAWVKTGYRKKPQCELCGFKLKFPSQSNVYYVDGNLRNNDWHNLKTVCLNCQQELYKSKVAWKPGEILPDF